MGHIDNLRSESNLSGLRASPLNVPVERVAVFRALQVGDLLCAVPALRALRRALPDSHITLIGLPWAEEFAHRYCHYVDGFLPFPGAPGLPERAAAPDETTRFVADAQAAEFDLALQLHGSGRYTNSIVTALGARHCAGFYRPGEPCPDTERFLAFHDSEHEIERLLRLLSFLGIPSCGTHIDFPISDRERRVATELQILHGLQPGDYVCIHAGARMPTRRWKPDRFARVADSFAARGVRVVLTGTLAEVDLTTLVQHLMKHQCVNLTGRTSLGELGALMTGARVVVCNDTGVSHLAAALRVPSVVIHMGSAPARWAPLDKQRHRSVYRQIDCRPCEHWHCPIEHPCAEGVLVEEVMREAEGFLV